MLMDFSSQSESHSLIEMMQYAAHSPIQRDILHVMHRIKVYWSSSIGFGVIGVIIHPIEIEPSRQRYSLRYPNMLPRGVQICQIESYLTFSLVKTTLKQTSMKHS